mmetsp:Transcript_19708/g.58648  ORF Transcript_19708/g.58648 Transcript_19708/m.58648 type:complete len:214 (-) Transcript_19708:276-917(-)
MRRSMKGRSTVCSFLTTLSLASSSPSENHFSKSASLWKMSGSRKLRSAQSSLRLFWSGVPVMRRRNCVGIVRTMRESDEFGFLMRCASSMSRYFQSILQMPPFSRRMHSYEVTRTSKVPGWRSSRRQRARSFLSPSSLTGRMVGHHLRNSRIQLLQTDLGTMTMCGPVSPRDSCRYASSEMDWSVLPRPISSARMPLMPLSCSFTSQLRPSSW